VIDIVKLDRDHKGETSRTKALKKNRNYPRGFSQPGEKERLYCSERIIESGEELLLQHGRGSVEGGERGGKKKMVKEYSAISRPADP